MYCFSTSTSVVEVLSVVVDVLVDLDLLVLILVWNGKKCSSLFPFPNPHAVSERPKQIPKPKANIF